MRIFFATIVWVVFIGGLTLYMYHRDYADDLADSFQENKLVEKVYSLEVTPSFALESDPFALTMDRQKNSPVLLVRMGGHEILKVDDPLAIFETFTIKPLRGLLAGKNEIYIEANPSLNHSLTQNALRVRIIENGYPVAEKTIWSPPGAKVSGTFQFTLKSDDNNFSEE